MAKKPAKTPNVVHEFKSKSLWSGKVTMQCGAVYEPGNNTRVNSWTHSVDCPGCKNGH